MDDFAAGLELLHDARKLDGGQFGGASCRFAGMGHGTGLAFRQGGRSCPVRLGSCPIGQLAFGHERSRVSLFMKGTLDMTGRANPQASSWPQASILADKQNEIHRISNYTRPATTNSVSVGVSLRDIGALAATFRRRNDHLA